MELNKILVQCFGLSDDEIERDEGRHEDFGVEGRDEPEYGSSNEDEAGISTAPAVGMYFSSIDDLHCFYQKYAKCEGFSVVKRSMAKDKSGRHRYITISCDKGRRLTNQNLSKKTGCPAKLSGALKENEMWQVTKFDNNHNHELDPSQTRFMAGHRHIDKSTKRILEVNDIAGIRPCKNLRLVEVQAGGAENMNCLPRDCLNYINSNRRLGKVKAMLSL